jgi:predicted HTH domain antitoxin
MPIGGKQDKKEVSTVGEKSFEVSLPEEILSYWGWQEGDVARRVREALVMELLRKHEISQGKAAELLGVNRWDLFELMGHYEVPAIALTPEELQRELAGDTTRGGGDDRR